MITVIVPVYNVKPYLRNCLDSIIEQTYRNLEILVIDDGSNDGSAAICDEYQEHDSRIRVFHTKNCGLSAARNLGLENAKGKYIGFVDSDDWVELNMYEVLLKKAEETGADVVECGWFREFPNITEERKKHTADKSKMDAVKSLLRCELSDCVWNKIWKKNCFSNIRFPTGRIYEDIATTYKVYASANLICCIDECEYHYRQRERSLTTIHNMDNLLGMWLSHKERYDALNMSLDETYKMIMLKSCGEAIARTWSNYYGCAKAERIAAIKELRQMNAFARDNYPLLGYKGWRMRQRIGIVFPHFLNPISLGISFLLDCFYKFPVKCKGKRYET